MSSMVTVSRRFFPRSVPALIESFPASSLPPFFFRLLSFLLPSPLSSSSLNSPSSILLPPPQHLPPESYHTRKRATQPVDSTIGFLCRPSHRKSSGLVCW